MNSKQSQKTKTKKDADAEYAEMTQGPLRSLIIRLAVPAIISNLVTTIYSLSDTFFIGRLGTAQSGAMGIAFSVMTVIQAMGFFFGNGAGNSMSRELGKHNDARAARLLSVGFVGALASGLVITVVGLATLHPLVRMLGATPTIEPYAVTYLIPLLVAAPMMCGSFALNCLLRYQGLASLAMIGLVTGSVLNLVLEPVFIFLLHMGMFGASLATAICQTISFVILAAFGMTYGVVHFSLRQCRITVPLAREIAGGGLPSMIRNAAGTLAVTCVNIAANPFGDAAIAGMAIVMRIMLGANSIMIGLGQGFQPVCGYNYGAGLHQRVMKGFWFCVKVATIAMLAFAAIIWITAPDLVRVFRDDAAVVTVGTAALRFQCCTLALNGYNMMDNTMQQTIGKTVAASFLAFCRLGLFLAPTALILPHVFGITGVECAQCVSDVLTLICTIPVHRRILDGLRQS